MLTLPRGNRQNFRGVGTVLALKEEKMFNKQRTLGRGAQAEGMEEALIRHVHSLQFVRLMPLMGICEQTPRGRP